MIRRTMFNTTHSIRPLYQQPYAQAGGNASLTPAANELDLRAWFDEILFGYESGVRHGQPILIRHLNRDGNGKPVDCTCKDTITREPDPDCSYCLGEGYTWHEEWYWSYINFVGSDGGLANKIKYLPPGNIRVDYKTFYLRYDTPILYGDKPIEVRLDTEGNIIQPLSRKSIYTPQTINEHRSDNGRIEFISVSCREGDALRVDRP